MGSVTGSRELAAYEGAVRLRSRSAPILTSTSAFIPGTRLGPSEVTAANEQRVRKTVDVDLGSGT